MVKGWHQEYERHALARMGIKTAVPKVNKYYLKHAKPNESANEAIARMEKEKKEEVEEDLIEIDGAKEIKRTEGDNRLHGRGISVELDDGTEWLIFDSYEDAEKACVEDVEEQLREDPSMFSQEWLQNHLSVTDTDRRIMADEEADNRLEDFEGTDEEKEAEREKVYDEWYEGLKNPVSFLVDEQGIYSREDLLKQNFISIDYDEASKDAVDTDGVAHFFASYDGEEKVLKDGKYAYRTN